MIQTVNRIAAAMLLAGLAFVGGAHFQAHRWTGGIEPASQHREFAPWCVEDEIRREGVRPACEHIEGTWRYLP